MALFFLAYTLFGWLRHRPATAPVASTWTHRIIERGGGITWLVLFNLTGASMFLRFGGGPYLLAVLMFFMFAVQGPRATQEAGKSQASSGIPVRAADAKPDDRVSWQKKRAVCAAPAAKVHSGG